MQTYSHFLWTLALYRWLSPIINDPTNSALPQPVTLSAVLWGSIWPDLPLITIAVICIIADSIRHTDDNSNDSSWTDQLFSTWYFSNPWVKAAHNLFHSCITLSVMLSLAYYRSKAPNTTHNSSATWCFWALMACCLHTLCDIPVHHDDGPLIFFPLNWDYRFRSPLSYWDPAYHGREFGIFEHGVDACILLLEGCRRCCGSSSRDPVRYHHPPVDDNDSPMQEVDTHCADPPDLELETFETMSHPI